MAETSKIQWTDSTWNPWLGCRKVSQGCKFCYAERWAKRIGGEFTTVRRTSEKTFNAPLKWIDGRTIFTCSLSDFFIEDADEWRYEAWTIIQRTPQHTYQILTKRPENIFDRLPHFWKEKFGHIWLGISAESEPELKARHEKERYNGTEIFGYMYYLWKNLRRTPVVESPLP